MVILLHEYAHHFLISSQHFAMPLWMSEGAAEFFSSTGFKSDGTVDLGKPNLGRGYELFNAVRVPIRQLLDEVEYRKHASKSYDSFYGRSWLLYHYLTFSTERQGQLVAYWKEIGTGTPHIAAAEKVFGDLDVLDKELDRYLKARKMRYFPVSPDKLTIGPVSVSALSAGNAEMLPVIMESKRGVSREQATALVARARTIAQKYPADAAVQAALAEAEFDAGNNGEAIAAADRAIAADPQAKNALVQKGLALFALAAEADDPAVAYQNAMEPFSALNKLENDHPYPLMYYYRSFAERGIEPPENANFAMERAAQLAPFDLGLAFSVAMMEAQDGQLAQARAYLQPIAASPHGGSFASQARALDEFLQSKPEGQPVELGAFMAAQAGAETTEEGPAANRPSGASISR
jgi:Flp pilus assembly protein TadD